MVQTADGGGGGGRNNPYAGPNEKKLMRALQVRDEALTTAKDSWDAGAKRLSRLADRLETQADKIAEAYESNGGIEAAKAFRAIKETVLVREAEMTRMAKAVKAAQTAVADARTAYHSLPPVSSPADAGVDPDAVGPKGNLTPEARDARKANTEHVAAVGVAESEAARALSVLDSGMTTAAEEMNAVAGVEPPESRIPANQAPPTTPGIPAGPPRTVPDVTTSGPPDSGPGDNGSGYDNNDNDSDNLTIDIGDVAPPDSDVDDGGDLSGGPTVGPGQPPVLGGGPASTPGVGVGSGAVGAAGLAALTRAGAIAGTRGPGGPRAIVKPGAMKALGGTVASSTKGTLGKSVVGAQGTTGGGKRGADGAGGRGGGRTIAAGAGQGAGRTGGRGAAGGRSTVKGSGKTAAARGKGNASGGKAPLSAQATGGTRGKRDRDRDQKRDGVVFDDEQSWLDDEQAGDAVID